MNPTQKRRGHYLGTEIDEQWWRRYSEDGLLARGTCECWIDDSALFFRRCLPDAPIVISFSDVVDGKTGKWHSGRWAGAALIVKIVWRKGESRLSSGLVLSRDARETETAVQGIRSFLGQRTTVEPEKPFPPPQTGRPGSPLGAE